MTSGKDQVNANGYTFGDAQSLTHFTVEVEYVIAGGLLFEFGPMTSIVLNVLV